ncbi:MAG TPA: HYR domain-containing protein, partial [Blastocatellia bacterium]|nr:HYR domain-containing protein [Blastocatellia bacterium]
LPDSVTFVSCSTTGNGLCLGSGNNRRVTFGAIPAGASATITLVTTVNSLASSDVVIINTASVSASSADFNLTNNSTTALTAIAGAPPVIQCPSNIVINAAAAQCSVNTQFPLPTITDSRFNLSVTCSPPSGSVFPVGTTTVNCIARDSDTIRGACSFSITVNSPQSFRLTLEGGAQALSFGPADVKRKNKKPPQGCDCDSSFTIENTGCAALNLTLDSIMRTGSDVTSGRITNPDDSKTFFVSVASNNQFSDLAIGATLSIPVGQSRSFQVLFKPRLPVITGKTTGLSAADLLPDLITSKITFRQSGTEPIVVNLTGRILTDVKLINPDDARGQKRARLTKSGNEFEVKFGVYDADLDVNRATFEFMDASGRVVQEAFDVDLAQPIREQNINKGQSFVITQRFTGAADHPEVVSVRVKVSDPHSSDAVTARLE